MKILLKPEKKCAPDEIDPGQWTRLFPGQWTRLFQFLFLKNNFKIFTLHHLTLNLNVVISFLSKIIYAL